ncbi:phage scaffolding protein [Alkaliphilus sp. MSJ-5]|uniref:Phage scaffolding protein n=1 Tax=Alkaliphilus flagellatus TaxID=2841507 RepID=A0ABS6G5K1_9FIRM|nr:phage scaffolding protein [Alkaliphilus flagellatus]MBU5677770.1 phage scaffolding protein [Alkaliphilus flagellatus]
MEWLKKLIEKHIKDGALNQEEFIKEVNSEFPKHAVPKETYNTLAETKTKLENDIKDRDKQLEDLKKVDAEGLQAEITRLQEENKTAKETYEKELNDIQITNAIKLVLDGKVHDESIVSNLLDKSKLIISDDGKIVGLDEQINSLKEGKAFLFKDENVDPNNPTPGFQKIGNPPPNDPKAIDSAVSAAFGNTEK